MILEVICFLLGIHLSMMMVASCYRLIDLWYRLREFIVGILARIIVVAALNAIFMIAFQDAVQIAFISGQLFFLVFHVVIFWIGRLLVMVVTRN